MFDSIKNSVTGSNFHTNWRPMMGWAGVVGVWIAFAVYPIVEIIDAVMHHGVKGIPSYPIEQLLVLVAYVLGKSFIRHIDKKNGTATISTEPYAENDAEDQTATDDFVPFTSEFEPTSSPTDEKDAPWNNLK